jgi:hypothetical protein
MNGGGVISGTASALGHYSFTVKVQDSQKQPAYVTGNFTLVVQFPITTTVLPQGTVGLAYTTTLGASGGTPPYTWSLVSGSLPDGLNLVPAGTISGTPTTQGTSSFTVQAMDSLGNTSTALLSIIINPAITNAAMKGNYIFTFSGYSNGTPVMMAGSFVADGQGNITSGVLDYNNGTGESGGGNNPPPQNIVPGQSSYSVQPNGLGAMTLVTDFPATYNLSISIRSDGAGRLIQSDPAQPQNYGSGEIKSHTPVSQWPLCGSHVALGLSGVDSTLVTRYAAAGEFQFDPNTCLDAESGVMDVNDGGSSVNTTFTGAFNQLNLTTSRGIAGITLKVGGRHFFAFYLVSSSDHKTNQLILLSTDPGAPLTLWSGLQQASPPAGWNNQILNGTSVAELSALDTTAAVDVSTGLFAGSGSAGNNCQGGNYDPATLNFDESQGGTATLQQSSTGTYCVDKVTGRVTLTAFSAGPFTVPPVFYMVKGSQAFVVGTDLAVTSGYLEQQTGPPFQNSSITGPYAGGTVTPVTSAVTNAATWLSSDGNGNISGSENTSGIGGPGTQPLVYTYSVDSTGRIVVQQNGSTAAIMYVISPTKEVLLPILNPDGSSDTSPALSLFQSSTSN